MSRKWTRYNYYATPREEDTGITIEWEENSGGYDWECWALISKKQGDVTLYASYHDSGCSCRGPFEEKPEDYNFAWTPNLKEAASQVSRALREISTDRFSDYNSAQKAELLADFSRTVMKLR